MDVKRIAAAADWSALASSLSGRTCYVRFETPTTAGDGWVLGLHWKMQGKSIIQIDPARVDDDDFLRVFCHETAHSRLHFDDLHNWQSKAAKLANGRRLAALPASEPTAKYIRGEGEADHLAARWLGWCKTANSLETAAFILGVMAGLAATFPALNRSDTSAAR